jgi:HAD superfamily hydrolase (TIGR01509 family)
MAGMVEHFTTTLPVIDGAIELVDKVRALGVATALVTSSFRVLLDAALVRLGPHRFDVTIAGDEVERGKPDPEPYRTGCERLSVLPGQTVVVEDALNGVTSAEGAGCHVVVVPSVAAIPPAPRRRVVGSLAAIDPHWLVDLSSSAT